MLLRRQNLLNSLSFSSSSNVYFHISATRQSAPHYRCCAPSSYCFNHISRRFSATNVADTTAAINKSRPPPIGVVMSDHVAKDLSELRLTYQKGELLEASVDPNPHHQFLQWLNEALAAQLDEPYAMSLATASTKGRPHVRTVLLRGAESGKGYSFYTNHDSQKGADLAENPFAQLLFYWPALERQVRISGRVERVSEEESEAYYHKRPFDSQVAAHVSTPQSGVIGSREELQSKFDALLAKQCGANGDAPFIAKPTFWGGYRVVPDYYEFWQGRPNRLHDRLCYQKKDGDEGGEGSSANNGDGGEEWVIQRLMP